MSNQGRGVIGVRAAAGIVALFVMPAIAAAQGGERTPRGDSLRAASRLDSEGKTVQARELFQRLIDSAPDPASKAAAQRAMAMSYAFDGDCANTIRYEEMVIAYWVTREQAEPQNAFYQQGEMANEAARVCIDAGKLDDAERMYRRGTDLGLKEPEPRTHPKSLWDFRLAHALARLSARRGDGEEAYLHIEDARRALDSDATMAAAQERFFPYLLGYVALYTGELDTAVQQLTGALAIQQNQNDPFMHTLLGMAYEKRGERDQAMAEYQRAYELSGAHNPPSAFARPFTRAKLGAGR